MRMPQIQVHYAHRGKQEPILSHSRTFEGNHQLTMHSIAPNVLQPKPQVALT